MIDANLSEYDEHSDSLSWVSSKQVREAEFRRARMFFKIRSSTTPAQFLIQKRWYNKIYLISN